MASFIVACCTFGHCSAAKDLRAKLEEVTKRLGDLGSPSVGLHGGGDL